MRSTLRFLLALSLLCTVLQPCRMYAQDDFGAVDSSAESIARGTKLFESRGCSACHAVDGKTASLGPNLGKRDRRLSRNDALITILHPSREILKGYESVVVVTESGKVHTGRLVARNEEQVRLMSAVGKQVETVEIPTEEIEETLTVNTSLMPTDLLRGLESEQVGHLLNYLADIGIIDPALPNKPLTAEDLHSGHSHMHGDMKSEADLPDDRPKFESVDHEIVINVVPKRMQYDVELFDVRPGSRVRLTLVNNDEMQHNLFVCTEGRTTWLDVARAAWALGAEGPARRWTPQSEKILTHTRLVDSQSSDTIDFRAPEKEGVYPFVCTLPGHAFLMRGEMHVTTRTRGLTDIDYELTRGSWNLLPDFTTLQPDARGELTGLPGLDQIDHPSDQFAVIFRGTLNVPEDGDYKFLLLSDDGSRILLNGETVVEYDGIHADEMQREGEIALQAGAHPFELQFFEAGGGEVLLAAWSGPGFRMLPLTADPKTLRRLRDMSEFILKVTDRPRVIRVRMPDVSSRAVAVGLVGGLNYCFDAGEMRTAYAWRGGFINVGPDRGFGTGRGGGVCRPSGPTVPVMTAEGIAVRRADGSEVRPSDFLGYRLTEDGPVFRFLLAGSTVEQLVTIEQSDAADLKMDFSVSPALSESIRIAFDASAQLTSDVGEVDADNALVIPPGSSKFSVTVGIR